MLRRHICFSRISDFVILHVISLLTFTFHSDWGLVYVIGKIKQNELDCRDTAPLTCFLLTLCVLLLLFSSCESTTCSKCYSWENRVRATKTFFRWTTQSGYFADYSKRCVWKIVVLCLSVARKPFYISCRVWSIYFSVNEYQRMAWFLVHKKWRRDLFFYFII